MPVTTTQQGLASILELLRPPLTSHEVAASTSMMAQVVTTGLVMFTGPIWNRTVLVSGDA